MRSMKLPDHSFLQTFGLGSYKYQKTIIATMVEEGFKRRLLSHCATRYLKWYHHGEIFVEGDIAVNALKISDALVLFFHVLPPLFPHFSGVFSSSVSVVPFFVSNCNYYFLLLLFLS